MKAPYIRGLSLVDVIVGVALLLIIFMALFGMFRVSIALTAAAKARAGATALATEQMEYIRSVTYADTGTVGGIPSGVIEPTIERTLNGRTYTIRTFIQYIDDPADGLDGDDENGVITDYKKIKVEASYPIGERVDNVSLVSNRTPRGIETVEGGGTLRISVIDAVGDDVSSAQVRIQNSNTSPAVDVTTFTGSGGFVFLPGAEAAIDYIVTVTKNGYSSTGTYDLDSENVSPDPGHLTVVEAATTQSTFVIDILSSLRVQTWEKVREGSFDDTFVSAADLETTANTEVVSGNLVLTNDAGVYETAGVAESVAVSPNYISVWKSFTANDQTPGGTTLSYQFLYDNDGVPTLLPEEVLPGNAAGFTGASVDLTSVPASSYPSISIRANLQTNDTSVTPEVEDWSIEYDEGPIPAPDVVFTLEGSKTIGQDGSGVDIKKHVIDNITSAAGWAELSDIEWDSYDFSVSGYDLAELCDINTLAISPNTSSTIDAYLESNSAHSLRVVVYDDSGVVVEGANVLLTRTGYSENEDSTSCGQTYFGSLREFSNYALEVSKSGFVTESVVDVDVSGDTVLSVVLSTS